MLLHASVFSALNWDFCEDQMWWCNRTWQGIKYSVVPSSPSCCLYDCISFLPQASPSTSASLASFLTHARRVLLLGPCTCCSPTLAAPAPPYPHGSLLTSFRSTPTPPSQGCPPSLLSENFNSWSSSTFTLTFTLTTPNSLSILLLIYIVNCPHTPPEEKLCEVIDFVLFYSLF